MCRNAHTDAKHDQTLLEFVWLNELDQVKNKICQIPIEMKRHELVYWQYCRYGAFPDLCWSHKIQGFFSPDNGWYDGHICRKLCSSLWQNRKYVKFPWNMWARIYFYRWHICYRNSMSRWLMSMLQANWLASPALGQVIYLVSLVVQLHSCGRNILILW